jgi:glycosyltransferase involved in cell wall biosynthesis
MQFYEKMDRETTIHSVWIAATPLRFPVDGMILERHEHTGLHRFLPGKLLKMVWSYILGFFDYILGFRKLVQNYDILESCELANMFTLQSLNSGKPTVVYCFENIPNQRSSFVFFFVNRIKKAVLKKAKYFIACDERVKANILLENPDILEENILVSPSTIDLERFSPRLKSPELQKRYNINPGKITILFCARLIYEKGIYDLLYAIKQLSRTRDDFELLVLGKSMSSGKIYKLVHDLWIEKFVRFSGFIPYSELHQVYNNVDIFVLPSTVTKIWNEQFWYVLLEAMASALPIVGTHSGSLPYVINPTGRILVSPADFYLLAWALEDLIEHPEKRALFWENNRKYMETEQFNPTKILADRERFYKMVIEKSR